jgi:hypothetical protein
MEASDLYEEFYLYTKLLSLTQDGDENFTSRDFNITSFTVL